jgi:hypothetical protein
MPNLLPPDKFHRYFSENLKLNEFSKLIDAVKKSAFIYEGNETRVVFAPELGTRVFVEMAGLCLHRLDIETVRNPQKDFNNFGGNNFWPAPEGGRYGFNYEGNTWRVQKAINNEPFILEAKSELEANAFKETVLHNRMGTKLNVKMERNFSISDCSSIIKNLKPYCCFSYIVSDSIEVLNSVKSQDALIASWSLEQFEATAATRSFAKVNNPRQSINFDYYADAGSEITYTQNGFFYETQGDKLGQIGIKKEALPEYIGFYDLNNKILCIREIIGSSGGFYFNIADNEQLNGPNSAADLYSIFNGGKEQVFFELETIGGAIIKNGLLKGSRLISRTSFGIFDTDKPIKDFITQI